MNDAAFAAKLARIEAAGVLRLLAAINGGKPRLEAVK